MEENADQISPARSGAEMPTPHQAAEHDKNKASPCATPTKVATPKPDSPHEDRAQSGVW